MTKELLYKWMDDPGRMEDTSLQELEKVVVDYPCFTTSRMLLTKSMELHDSNMFEEELARTAVLCCDRRQLLYLIRHEQYAKFLTNTSDGKKQTADRTEALLNSFLSTLSGKESKENILPDDHLQVAVTDYFAYLESLGDDEEQIGTAGQPFQHQDIIDAFIEKAETDEIFITSELTTREKRHESGNEADGGEFLTETLARIYINQHKYEQARTIIERLSLNFPKKSVYFADQIRFLELLIANEKNKNK